MVCSEALAFLRERERDAEPQQRHDGARRRAAAASERGAVGIERSDDRRARRRFTATTMASSAGDAGSCSGPRAQQHDVDDDAEQCAEIHKHNAGRIVHVTRRTAPLMIDTADALTAFAASAASAPALALDTEFMREKTYRAELCLLQIAARRPTPCASIRSRLPDLSALAPLLGAPGVVKIMHAARQDLEVLLPAVGLVQPVFDTQIAAALAGHPVAGRLRRARAAPARRGARQGAHARRLVAPPAVAPKQQEYALDDVRHLGRAARELVRDARRARDASPGSRKSSRRSPIADALRVAPEDAWKKVKGLPALDPARQQLAQALAAWRERRAVERNRPRGWILDDAVAARNRAAPAALARSARGAAGDAGVRGAQMRRGTAGAGARSADRAIRRRRCRAANAPIPRSSRS